MPILGQKALLHVGQTATTPPVKGKVRGRHQDNAHTTAGYYVQKPQREGQKDCLAHGHLLDTW